jgi:uncharacterized membrane protein (DUF485 family)
MANALDYCRSAPAGESRLSTRALAFFTLLPILAIVLLLLSFVSAMGDEPFMAFSLHDAVTQLALPTAVLAIWIAWFMAAIPRFRAAWLPLVPVACWAAANLWLAGWIARSYFHEPWNR